MIIVLLGASGAGKSSIERELAEKYNFNKITSFTTRMIRDGETNGRDYYFVSNSEFEEILEEGQFAEYEEYSQNRFYGTLKNDYTDEETDVNKVVVLTPNGYKQLQKNIDKKHFFSVLVTANLGTRMKRYIDRCGVEKFNYDDKNEIASRVERDFGAFMGVNGDVDLIVDNSEGTDIEEIVNKVLIEFKAYKEKM